jgi:2-succinyl-5-enolpyruvyl-6-hydroxy-3-cyclohexene-1-carboxylate synthase
MILVGQRKTNDDLDLAIDKLTDNYDCAVLKEHLSNMDPGNYINNFDALLYALPKEKWEKLAPDLLITLGGQIVSKRIKEFICMHPPKEHWHISFFGDVVDTYQCLTNVIEGHEIDFISYINDYMDEHPDVSTDKSKAYYHLWLDLSRKIDYPDKVDFSDLYAINEFMKVIPRRCSLHLTNSSTVRLAQLCRLESGYSVLCNRGTSGIDGCVSVAVGYASVCEEDFTFLITGDLAFFYDMNALWNRQIDNKIRILLNNNGGGEIFYTLPELNQSEALHTYVSASHNTSAKGWAESVGFTYLPVSNKEELHEHLPAFISKSDKPILMEVFTSKEENARILHDYYHSLKID